MPQDVSYKRLLKIRRGVERKARLFCLERGEYSVVEKRFRVNIKAVSVHCFLPSFLVLVAAWE